MLICFWPIIFRYYEAVIEEIDDENMKVKFEGYNTLEVVSIQDVKSVNSSLKRPLSGDEGK